MLRNLHFGERDVRLRELRAFLDRAIQHAGSFLELAGEPQVVAEYHGVFRQQLSGLFERTHVGDCEIVLAGGCVGDGARAARHEQARILREHRGQLADGDLGLARARPSSRDSGAAGSGCRPSDPAAQPAACRLAARPAKIAERAQALQRLRIRRCSGGARRGLLSKRGLETMTQLGDACGVRIREVRQFRSDRSSGRTTRDEALRST